MPSSTNSGRPGPLVYAAVFGGGFLLAWLFYASADDDASSSGCSHRASETFVRPGMEGVDSRLNVDTFGALSTNRVVLAESRNQVNEMYPRLAPIGSGNNVPVVGPSAFGAPPGAGRPLQKLIS